MKKLRDRKFFKKNYFWLFDVFWHFKLQRIALCYCFLLFRLFMLPFFITKLTVYSLATDITTSFTCFKPQHYTRKSSFYLFSMAENPVKPCITKSRKNMDKQDKIDLEKQTLSSGLQNDSYKQHPMMGKICMC